MPVIDADTHVDETEATWDYLSQQSPKYVPATMEPPAEEKSRSGLSASRSRFWLVEGRIQVRAIRDDIHHPARPRRELEDLEGRIADMDKMGVDIQVLFPTFFIRYVAQNPLPEAELAKSYNRWIAEICANTNGRMRWAAVLPWLDADAAIKGFPPNVVIWPRRGFFSKSFICFFELVKAPIGKPPPIPLPITNMSGEILYFSKAKKSPVLPKPG